MEFYHPEDMPILKEAYEMIMRKSQTAGVSFYGKPYRMLTHNGCYITVETEWSSFVNPWSRHLKFVIGHHRVLKGPANPNVLAQTNSSDIKFDEGVLKASKIIQEEILKLLTELVHRPSDRVQQVSKRCQVLASFMETLMDEVKNSGSKADLKLDLPQESAVTFSELDSVMLGEVSPHHDYFDSKSSSETPPSYNQLNYSENLQRFFDSKPITKKTDPEQQAMELNDSEPETRANSSSMQYSGESGCSESAGNMSSTSHPMASTTNTSTGTSQGSYVSPTLTEAVMCKHNEDMEKLIIKRHKVSRTGKGDKNKKANEKMSDHLHGVKRSGSYSWEGEAHKQSKHQHNIEVQKAEVLPTHASSQMFPSANADLWPPFSVSLTTMQNTHTTAQPARFSSNIFPTVYYIPQNIAHQDQTQALQYMPSVLYQPIMYQHPSTFYQMQLQHTISQSNMNLGMTTLQSPFGSSPRNQRPASQATSAKADMGSTSASVVNRV